MFIAVPADFLLDGPVEHTFSADNFEIPYCFNVVILDDMACEDLETFNINVVSEDLNVRIKIPTLTVQIRDNDSKRQK